MASIDDLINLSVEEGLALTDEQLMERFKDVFILEPTAPILVEEESTAEPKIKTPKVSKKQKEKDELKNLMLNLSGLEADLRKQAAVAASKVK